MTHIPGKPIAFDPPNDWKPATRVTCRGCGGKNVRYRTHESSDGGYEDDEFKCLDCRKTWWVDGIDS